MTRHKLLPLGLIALIVVIFLLTQALFIVNERQQAIVLQLGQPVGDVRGPGLHFKIPLVQNVRLFDSRILAVDPDPEQVVIASAVVTRQSRAPTDAQDVESEQTEEQSGDDAAPSTMAEAENVMPDAPPPIENVSGEPIIVDSFARYRISDPLQFMKTLRDIDNANSRLENILEDATRTVLGQSTLKELLSTERNDIMNEIRQRVNRITSADELGIEIVDVRIVRADLTSELRDSTVRRMISELRERATETRALGEERALEIRSTADKERSILLAEARRDAEIIKGEGDQQAIRIYADAFNKDREFYGFLRSMEAYKTTLADPQTRMILSPDSQFFRFFNNLSGDTQSGDN